MSKGDDCRALVKKAARKFGGIDILVNNAGIQHVAPVDEFPAEQWDRIIAINLSSAFHTTAAALPLMKTRKWGRIVNIASAHGLRASPFKSAYVSAKHGILGLTKTVALEVAGQGITCNAICPGYVLTPLVEAQIPDQMKAHNMDRETVIREVMLDRQPTREFATVEQIGGTVAVPLLRHCRADHRHADLGRRRLDRAVRRSPRMNTNGRRRGKKAGQHRAAGRRLAWRILLGRARPPARGWPSRYSQQCPAPAPAP